MFFKGSGTNTIFHILGSQTKCINNINQINYLNNNNDCVYFIYHNENYSNKFFIESNPIKFFDHLQVTYENIDIPEWHFEEFSSELEYVHIYNCSFRNPKTDHYGYFFLINTPIFEFINSTIVYETHKEGNTGLQINYTN